MSRFMIELDHEAETYACAQAVQVFLATGSHYLTKADWGCLDGVHTAWLVVEADTREQARSIVPPAFRARARVTALNAFGMEEIEEILSWHGPGAGRRKDGVNQPTVTAPPHPGQRQDSSPRPFGTSEVEGLTRSRPR